MSTLSMLRPRTEPVLRSVLCATLLSVACRDGAVVAPDPDPVPPPSYDLVFQETSAEGLMSERLMVRRLDADASTPLFGAQVLGWNPSPSADGSSVVFVSPIDNEPLDDWQDLYVVRRNAPPQRIPLAAGTESSPSLSPDGTRVAYVKRGADAVGRLYVAKVDGGGETAMSIPLAPGLVYHYSTPAWSPDGSTLLFSAGEPGSLDLYTVRTDGTGLRQHTSATGSDTEGSWSPDGRAVAFVRGSSPAQTTIVIRDLESGAERALAFPWRNRSPAWSPDGSRIAFASNMADNLDYELYVVRVDGTAVQRLTDDDVQQRAPRWLRR